MGALTGIRVLDFSWALAAPTATAALACTGAEVIRVESRHRLDTARYQESDDIFHAINRQKKAITLNLQHPRAVELAKQLVKLSDVVLESFRPGVIDRLGLGYEVLRKVKADIIMVSSSYQGSKGPEAYHAGYAPLFTAVSGLGDLTGYRDGPPAEIRHASDINVGYISAVAIIAALIRHRRTGKGCHIDVSCAETASCLVGESLLDYTINGRIPTRQGNDCAHLAPHNVYRCRDGWISIAIGSEEEWQSLRDVLGTPEWTQSSKFANPLDRWHNREELDQHLQMWTAQHDMQPLSDLLQTRGVAAIPSYDAPSLFSNPHVMERSVIESFETAAGPVNLVKLLGKLSLTPTTLTAGAPEVGQHNDEILQGLLGLTEGEIAELTEQDVLT